MPRIYSYINSGKGDRYLVDEENPPTSTDGRIKWEASPSGKVWTMVEALYRPVWYIRDRYGDKAVEDFLDWRGKELSEELRDMGVKDHFEFANWFANRERQLFGTEVEVDVSEEGSTITVRNCPRLATAIEWKERTRRTGAPRTITREEYCGMCTTVYLRSPAEGFRFEHQKEYTSKGCVHAFSEQI